SDAAPLPHPASPTDALPISPGAPAREWDAGVAVHRLPVHGPAPLDFPGWVLRLNLEMVERALHLFACGQRFDVIHAHDWLAAYRSEEHTSELQSRENLVCRL